MTSNSAPTRKRRMARESQGDTAKVQTPTKSPSKLDELQQLLVREDGASITEMVQATSWQQHSVRGAMAGSLKKRGLVITSEKVDSVRRYRGAMPA